MTPTGNLDGLQGKSTSYPTGGEDVRINKLSVRESAEFHEGHRDPNDENEKQTSRLRRMFERIKRIRSKFSSAAKSCFRGNVRNQEREIALTIATDDNSPPAACAVEIDKSASKRPNSSQTELQVSILPQEDAADANEIVPARIRNGQTLIEDKINSGTISVLESKGYGSVKENRLDAERDEQPHSSGQVSFSEIIQKPEGHSVSFQRAISSSNSESDNVAANALQLQNGLDDNAGIIIAQSLVESKENGPQLSMSNTKSIPTSSLPVERSSSLVYKKRSGSSDHLFDQNASADKINSSSSHTPQQGSEERSLDDVHGEQGSGKMESETTRSSVSDSSADGSEVVTSDENSSEHFDKEDNSACNVDTMLGSVHSGHPLGAAEVEILPVEGSKGYLNLLKNYGDSHGVLSSNEHAEGLLTSASESFLNKGINEYFTPDQAHLLLEGEKASDINDGEKDQAFVGIDNCNNQLSHHESLNGETDETIVLWDKVHQNSSEPLLQIRSNSGLNPDVLTGKDDGELDYLSCQNQNKNVCAVSSAQPLPLKVGEYEKHADGEISNYDVVVKQESNTESRSCQEYQDKKEVASYGLNWVTAGGKTHEIPNPSIRADSVPVGRDTSSSGAGGSAEDDTETDSDELSGYSDALQIEDNQEYETCSVGLPMYQTENTSLNDAVGRDLTEESRLETTFTNDVPEDTSIAENGIGNFSQHQSVKANSIDNESSFVGRALSRFRSVLASFHEMGSQEQTPTSDGMLVTATTSSGKSDAEAAEKERDSSDGFDDSDEIEDSDHSSLLGTSSSEDNITDSDEVVELTSDSEDFSRSSKTPTSSSENSGTDSDQDFSE